MLRAALSFLYAFLHTQIYSCSCSRPIREGNMFFSYNNNLVTTACYRCWLCFLLIATFIAFNPGCLSAGEYILSEIVVGGCDCTIWDFESPMPVEYTNSSHFSGAVIQDTTISHSASTGSYHWEMRIEQTPAGGSLVSTYDRKSSWQPLPIKLTPGTEYSQTITTSLDAGGAPLSYTPSISANAVLAGPDFYENTYVDDLRLSATTGSFSKSKTLTATVPVPTVKPSQIYFQVTTYVDSPYMPRRFTYMYSWEDGIDQAFSLYGGQASNPYTIFDGGAGPGSCSVMGLPRYWVNTSTLNLVVEDSDFNSRGLGPEVAMTRSYNADPSQTGMFGKGWKFAYESTIERYCGGILLRKGSGQVLNFTTASNICDANVSLPVVMTPTSGVHDRAVYYGSYFLYEEKESHNVSRYDQIPSTKTFRLTSITDANGNRLQLTYNSNGTLLKITDAAGRQTSFGYNADKRCTSMKTPTGDTATYAYNWNGYLTQSTDLLGTAVNYEYDNDGFMTSMSAAGKSTSFAYNSTGGWRHIASVTDARGKMKLYTVVSSSPRQISVTDPNGKITSYSSVAGKTTRVADPLGNVTTTEYTAGLPTRVTDAKGGVSLLSYDVRGNLISHTDAKGQVTSYTYDTYNNLIALKNSLNQTWTYTYDSKHNILTTKTPLGKKNVMTYNAQGQLTEVKDPSLQTTSFAYDVFGNITTVTDPLGNITTKGYDAKGLVQVLLKDPKSNSTTFEYDDNYRLTKLIHPDASVRSYGYDACATNSITDENGVTTSMSRDPLLYITSIKDGSGHTTTQSYDGNSNLTAITNPLQQTLSYTYDAANRRIKMSSPLGTEAVMAYDANNNLKTFTDERGKSTGFAYDSNNFLASLTDALGNQVTLTRDALGRITRVTNAQGSTVGYSYNADGYVTEKKYDGSSVATYSYNAVGDLMTVVDATGTLSYTRDKTGKVVKILYPDTKAVSMTYDAAGNNTSITYPGGLVVTYTYDNRNRVRSATWGGGAASYVYDKVGNLLTETRLNGIRSDLLYNSENAVTSIIHRKGTSVFAQMTYVRNALGNVIAEMTSLPSPSLDDRAETAVYNNAGQISTLAADVYNYDKDGNLTTISGGRKWNLVYNPENLPTSITRNGATSLHFYNGLKQRTQTKQGTQERKYHYDANGRLLFETNASGQVTASFIYNGKRLVAMRTSAGENHYYHFDKTGNTIAMTNSSGNVSRTYGYLPFGEIVQSQGTLANPFTYAGAFGVIDDGGGLYFMRNRYYDSYTGRFIQKDPIGFGGGTNLYAYVGGNPVNFIDSNGLKPKTLVPDPNKMIEEAIEAIRKKNPTLADELQKMVIVDTTLTESGKIEWHPFGDNKMRINPYMHIDSNDLQKTLIHEKCHDEQFNTLFKSGKSLVRRAVETPINTVVKPLANYIESVAPDPNDSWDPLESEAYEVQERYKP